MRAWLLVLLAAVVMPACAGSNDVTGPGGLSGDGSSRAGLLGAPPPSTAGPGAGTGAQSPDNRYSCAATSAIAANQNNGKVDLWLVSQLPTTAVLTRWVITDRRNGVVVASGISEPSDATKGRLFVFYPRNGGSYQAMATTVHTGNCAGTPAVVPFGFDKAPDTPDPAPVMPRSVD